jgi:hypothetical protein
MVRRSGMVGSWVNGKIINTLMIVEVIFMVSYMVINGSMNGFINGYN